MSLIGVRIRNFRSIVDDQFSPKNLSIIVGPNDVGKSNYLRVLNLFFNGQTDVGVPLNFASDYSIAAPIRKGKAKEISVELTIQPPSTYSEQRQIIWTKTWREDYGEPFKSFRRTSEGTELSPRSRVGAWLDRIKFKYVPAIKGDQYFRSLLRDLHDTLAETIDSELRGASEDFIGKIRKATGEISASVFERLSLKSEIQIPRDLRTVFEVLDFETAKGSRSVSLRQRGDGIKVRHIPAILKFLADQEDKLAAKGRPRVTTLWGYEEPENNLELLQAFDLGREFLDYSDRIQALITTHSPAFYALAKERPGEVVALQATVDDSLGTRVTVIPEAQLGEVDKALGLMQLVTPYVASMEKALAALKAEVEATEEEKKPIVFVGGETDEIYLERAVDVFGKKPLLRQVELKWVGESKPGGNSFSGDDALKRLVSFLKANPGFSQRRVLILFDCDANRADEVHGNLRIRGIERNLENTRVRRGIENLFPANLFEDKFYETKTQQTEYGGQNVIQIFKKVEFCEHICAGAWTEDQLKALFARFEPVIAEIEAVAAPT